MDEARNLSCSRCARPIPPGGSHYVMSLRLTAGFDGRLPDPPPPQSIASAVAACMELTEEELEESVDMLRTYTLCPSCREAIARDPLHTAGNGAKPS